MNIITSYGHGCFDAYEATVENAKAILSWQSIPEVVKTFAETKPTRWTTYESIERIIKKMLDKDVGELAFESKDGSVTIPVTAEAKAETVMYLFQKEIAPKEFSAYSMNNGKVKIEDLQWLFHFHGITLVDEWVSEWASKLRCINKDSWKEGVTEDRKINYILTFVNELCHRDERYELTNVKEKA
jgi:hypothetical protein